MEFIAKFILSVSGNIAALLVTAYFDKDFQIATDAQNLVSIAAMLALLNLTVRPILKLVFSPLISLTFGLFHIVISAAILYAIDIYFDSLTINGLWALLISAHLVAFIVVIIDYASTMVYGSGELT
jgi:putative membrane protein